MKTKIFITHINEEKELAIFLKNQIYEDFLGFPDIFVSSDPTSMRLGENWLNQLQEELREVQIVIVLCSNASIGRPWISFEAGAGMIREIPVIPVCHSGLRIKNLPAPFFQMHAIEANNETDLEKLYDKITTILKCKKPTVNFREIATQIKGIERDYMKPISSRQVYLTEDLFELLKRMKQKPYTEELENDRGIIHINIKKETQWTNDNRFIRDWLEDQLIGLSSTSIANMRGEDEQLRVISYSFISYFNRYETHLRKFLKNNGRLRVLMSNYESQGFYEKTALESIRDLTGKDPNIEAWRNKTELTRNNHKSDILNSINHLYILKDMYGDRVDFRVHSDTPNINGILFGNKAMSLIAYFLNPIARGVELPTLLVKNVNEDVNLQIVYQIVSNWFEVKYLKGRRPEKSKATS